MRIIDLSFSIENGMPTCGLPWHEQVRLKQLGKIDDVGRNTHAITFGSHTGTHMDAPYHFIETGKTIDQMEVKGFCGEISVADFTEVTEGYEVSKADVEKLKISEKMLFAFGWYEKWKTEEYYTNFPYFSESAIDYMIEKGLKFLAMDTPSPDNGNAIAVKDDSPNHKKLLKNDVIIVEYLNNTKEVLGNYKYEIFALPLKIADCDGSPCRVIVKESEK